MIKDRSMSKSLVILTTHFGMNFSGGSTATHQIFVRLEDEFNRIIVVCNKIGHHQFKKVEFKVYNSSWEAYKILRSLSNKDTIYYGDFYNSVLFVWAKKKFYFTYHDNWPEMKNTSLYDHIKSFFYIPIYNAILRSAEMVIAVSKYKMRYIEKFSRDVKLVYNGFNVNEEKDVTRFEGKNKIIMVGNVERRKYHIALRLFKSLDLDFRGDIDVYGNLIDKHLAEKLNSFPFVNIKGFVPSVPYKSYNCLLHTSYIENLPIAVCESIIHHLPVVAFDVGGISEVVNPSNGILVPPYDIKRMKNSIESMLSGGQVFSFSENDLSNFNWDIAARSYLKIMQLC
jgi:glycosyltransferase involved in cell wall biosynthesis